MNKQLEKKIEKLEALKSKAIEERNAVDEKINVYDKQLKVYYDYRKQQEKIYQMQEELNTKVLEN